jgi:hypothetical protein
MDSESRERFLASFIAVAGKGLFSYNIDMIRGHNAGYYLVAKPLNELKIGDLPPGVSTLVKGQRRRPDLPFATGSQNWIP